MSLTVVQPRFRLAVIEAGQGVALSLLDLPTGASLSDGKHRVQVETAAASVDISRWQLDRLELGGPPGNSAPVSLRLLAVQRCSDKLERKFFDVPLQPLPAQGLWVQGLPAGARLGDGTHTQISKGESEAYDLLGWNLTRLVVRPPRGWHTRLRLRLHVSGMSEEAVAELGQIQIKLYSPNAYLSGSAEELAQQSLPLMDIVVDGLMPEPQASLRVQVSPISEGFTGVQAEDKEIDDDDLLALEMKLRAH